MCADYVSEEDVKLRYITPTILKAGWDPNTQILMEHYINDGRVLISGFNAVRSKKRDRPDYILQTKDRFELAIVEAKSSDHNYSYGLEQAKEYAERMAVPFAYSSNGEKFREYDFITGIERDVENDEFPSPSELLARYSEEMGIRNDPSMTVPFYFEFGGKYPRYYQRAAVTRVLEAIEKGQKRVMVVMATGTGKTLTAMQLVHKLSKTDPTAKVLYLVDRNGLVDDAMTKDFKHFGDVMTKIQKKDPKSAFTIQFALYPQLVDNEAPSQPYTKLSKEFFDYIIVDECHRGSAREDSEWHQILDYFDGAVQIGMTATPREEYETTGISSSAYFGNPVYVYSYRQGVDDGFLAPFKKYEINLNVDDGWLPDPSLKDKNGNNLDYFYDGSDFDRKVIVDDRTHTVALRICSFLLEHDPYMKTIVFCETIDHAERMRAAIAQMMPEYMREDPHYVVRITGGADSDKDQLENFMSKTSRFPVIATTSELLTTGFDCFMTKVIVIDKGISSAIEFKQILGRGSRLDTDRDKWFFTLLDFRNASRLLEPGWDGVPDSYDPEADRGSHPKRKKKEKDDPKWPGPQYVDGHVDVHVVTEFESTYGPDGFTIDNFVDFSKKKMLEEYPDLQSFMTAWTNAEKKTMVINELESRGVLMDKIREALGRNDLDDFDVLIHVVYGSQPNTKHERADKARRAMELKNYTGICKDVLDSILEKYIVTGEKDFTSLDLLKLEDFKSFGGMVPIVKAFGGKEKYLAAVSELQNALYA